MKAASWWSVWKESKQDWDGWRPGFDQWVESGGAGLERMCIADWGGFELLLASLEARKERKMTPN